VMARVSHANVAVLFGTYDWRGTPVLGMEYLEGGTLAARLALGPMEPEHALSIAVQLAGALEYLQSVGLSHGDIKPSNIMCLIDGHGVVRRDAEGWFIDLTIAQEYVPNRADEVKMGTPGYAPPEQYRGRTQPSSDLYALGVTMFDVGAVAQIVATPKFMVFLTETFHGYRVVPTDGRKPREDVPPSYRGDSVGHWEGDVFVMETKNFTDDTWIYAEGQVSPHSDELRIVERYKRVDKNTLEIDATVYDPKMLTGPWTVPTRKLVLAPFDQILPLICSGTETGALMDAAAKQAK